MATQVAVKGAKTLPPSSPFGELLRRSKFAAYDPKIRQTYTAPASYISRGNWGLKRPIANKQRHSSIVLRNFEEHAHYIEWDKASAQVDLVKRVEELNMTPSITPSSQWAMGLSPTATMIDSEFESPQLLKEARKREENRVTEREQAEVEAARTREDKNILPFPNQEYNFTLLDSLPTRGRGGYGMSGRATKAIQEKDDSFVQFNIAAMSPRQFNAYLDEVRTLRPQFLKYIRRELQKTQNVDKIPDDRLVAHLGRAAVTKSLHRFFLAEHTKRKLSGRRAAHGVPVEEVANAPQPILGRPHQQAGLMYASPTIMETTLTTDAAPGFVLQNLNNTAQMFAVRDNYVTTFAGLTAVLRKSDAGAGSVVPLIEPWSEDGISAPLVGDGQGGEALDASASEHRMRMTELSIAQPPVVVGHDAPNKPIRRLELRSKVALHVEAQNVRELPYAPGSFGYANYLPRVSGRWHEPATYDSLRRHTRTQPNVQQRVGGESRRQGDKKEATMEVLKKMMLKPEPED